MWVGSDTNTALCEVARRAASPRRARSDSSVVRRLVLDEDRVGRHAVARWRSRARDGRLGRPVALGACRRSRRGSGATPAWYRSTAWSRRAAKTGDGRPSYWAAPRTTIASAGRARRGRPASQMRIRRVGRRPRRPATAIRAISRSARTTPADAAGQRPWHFLYLAPEPHQHGSLRPIRAPVGVKPGPRRPPVPRRPRPPLAQRLVAERFADAARTGRRRDAAGERPRRLAGRRPRRRRRGRRRWRPRRRRSAAAGPRAGALGAGAPTAPGRRRPGAGRRLAGDRDPEDRRGDAGGGSGPRSSSYRRNASRRNSLSGSCWA